jgi:protein FAM32A
MVSTSPAFIGGALSFKGDKKTKKAKKKSHRVKHETPNTGTGTGGSGTAVATRRPPDEGDEYDEMTEAERAAFRKKQERELKELETVAKQSHRERVEAFNEKLSQLTEHNDIPRVSAAGNG